MNAIDLSPLYRNSIGFDRMASLLNNALNSESSTPGYPPYNIEILEENRYAISISAAGFADNELGITVEKGVLTVHGKKADDEKRNYLHQGIANRSFEHKFNLAEHVEVTNAELQNGLLTIHLLKEIPEAMKPKTIPINSTSSKALNDISPKKIESSKAENDAKVAA